MTINEIGSIGELVGAVATVATLLYLAIQIRNSTYWSKGQALGSAVDRIVSWGARLNENPEMLDIYLKGLEEFDGFDIRDRERYHLILLEVFGALEVLHEHSKTGAIKVEATANSAKRIAHELRGTGAKAWGIKWVGNYFHKISRIT